MSQSLSFVKAIYKTLSLENRKLLPAIPKENPDDETIFVVLSNFKIQLQAVLNSQYSSYKDINHNLTGLVTIMMHVIEYELPTLKNFRK